MYLLNTHVLRWEYATWKKYFNIDLDLLYSA